MNKEELLKEYYKQNKDTGIDLVQFSKNNRLPHSAYVELFVYLRRDGEGLNGPYSKTEKDLYQMKGTAGGSSKSIDSWTQDEYNKEFKNLKYQTSCTSFIKQI